MEREAFKDLEEAMISASMPKRERIRVMQEMASNNDNGSGRAGVSQSSEDYKSRDQDI